jgi:hypothetical protein
MLRYAAAEAEFQYMEVVHEEKLKREEDRSAERSQGLQGREAEAVARVQQAKIAAAEMRTGLDGLMQGKDGRSEAKMAELKAKQKQEEAERLAKLKAFEQGRKQQLSALQQEKKVRGGCVVHSVHSSHGVVS